VAVKITTSLQKPVIILGIDPGTLVMGYSVVEASKNIFTIKTLDVLKLSSKKDHYQRLQMVHQKITELVDQYSPNEFAIEAPFFGKNVQSMLKLGRAQGVAIAAAMTKNIPVTEYSPRKIKQAITGNGNADKEQVWKMLQRITALPDKPKYFDATDALAVAICHFYGSNSLPTKKTTAAKKSSGWEKFIALNQHRVKP
jgi:crossover junction endodeoxyribonuclease RuvC